MTDMRATERLLEVIQEQVANAERDLEGRLPPVTESALTEILAIAIELRRRGDTLVRARDLEVVVKAASSRILHAPETPELLALQRIENAIGGKMR